MRPAAKGHAAAAVCLGMLLSVLVACSAHRPALPEPPPPSARPDDAELEAWQELTGNRLRHASAVYARLAEQRQGTTRARLRLLEALSHLLAADFSAALITLVDAVSAAPGSALAALATHQLAEVSQYAPLPAALLARLRQLCPAPAAAADPLGTCAVLYEGGVLAPGNAGEQSAWLLGRKLTGHPLARLAQAPAPRHPAGLSGPWLPARAGTLVLPAAVRPQLLELHSAVAVKVSGNRGTTRLLVVARGDTPWRLVLGGQVLERDAHRRLREQEMRAVLEARPGWLPIMLLLPRDSTGVEFTLQLLPLQAGTELRWLAPPRGKRLSLPTELQDSVALEALPPLAKVLADSDAGGTISGPRLLFAALAHWQQGRLDRTRALLERLLAEHPRAALFHFLLAVVVQEDELVPRPIDRGRALEQLNQALANCPEAGLARFRLALLQAEQDNIAEAGEQLQLLERQRPRVFLWPYLRGVLAEQVELPELAWQHYRRARRLWPDQHQAQEREAALLLARGRLEQARPLAQQLWKQGYRQPWLRLLQATGQEQRWGQALQEALGDFPEQADLLYQLAQWQARQGQSERARDTLLRLLRQALLDSNLLRDTANLLDRLGWQQQARQVWTRLRHAQPGDAGLWLAGLLHEGSKPVLPGEKRVTAREAIAAYRASGWQPDGELVRVLDHYHYQVGADGSSLVHIHQILHLRTVAAAEKWGEIQPPDDGAVILALRAIKPDGRSFQAQMISGKDTVSLPGLGAGDFVELDAVLGQAGPALALARAGWLSEPRLLAGVDEPVFDWQTSYLLPGSAQPIIDGQGRLPTIERQRLAGGLLLRLQRQLVPGLSAEALSPPVEELSPSVVVGLGQDWNSWRRALAAELRFATRPSAQVAGLAAANCPPTDSRLACLRNIFYWTCRNIGGAEQETPFEPADHVLARRQGRRLLVLVALLRAAGFAPRVLLARLPQAPALAPRLPRPNIYTQDVVAVEVEGRSYWLVPGGRHQPFTVLEPALRGAEALVVWPESARPFTHLPRSAHPATRRIKLRLKLAADGSLQGRGRESIPPEKAVAYRDILSDLDEAGRRRLLQAGLNNSFPGATLGRAEFRNLDKADEELVIEYDFTAARWATVTAERWLLPGSFFPYQLGRNLPLELPRRQPVLIEDETRTATRVDIVLPPGWRAADQPEVRLRAPLAEFYYRRRQQGQHLVLEKGLVVEPGRIAAAQAAQFRSFCLEVDRLDTQPLELQPARAR